MSRSAEISGGKCSLPMMITGYDPPGLLDMEEWKANWNGDDWREYRSMPEEPGEVELFRLTTTVGRPLGREEFITQLEVRTGRSLHPRAVGRPKRNSRERKLGTLGAVPNILISKGDDNENRRKYYIR